MESWECFWGKKFSLSFSLSWLIMWLILHIQSKEHGRSLSGAEAKMTRKSIISVLAVVFLLGCQFSRAQDSLRLLATIVGERECASAGDVNGDGFKDIITGYPGGDGYVKIFLGGANFDTIADLQIMGDGGSFGSEVGCAGDLNKDGYDDIIVGAPSASNPNNGAELAGKAHIYFGGSPMDTLVDLILQDSYWYYGFGSSVTSAGDVNNDGYDDAMVAAPDDWGAVGRVFIYLGGEDMDSIYDIRIEGHPDSAEHFGWSVAGIGDINSDEYDDILVGSPFAGVPWGTGKATIYFGGNPMDTIPDVVLKGDITTFYNFGRNVASAKDVDGDGIPDMLVSNTKKTKVFYGSSPSDTGASVTLPVGYSISSAGDVNQDGYGDVIASDDKYPQSTHIFYGGTSMDGEADITLKAKDTTLAGFGLKVACLGDINGDGYDKVMISSGGDSLRHGIIFIYTSNPTSVEESDKEEQVNDFHLSQNYPNPFNPGTVIEYVSPVNSRVNLSIYNILGQHIKTLVDEYQKAGHRKVIWNGTDQAGREVSSGVYFYRLKTESIVEVKKMLLLR